jgi:predicted nicotinamide N-methyase
VSLVLEAGGHRLLLERPDNLEDDGYQARGGGDAKPYWAFLWASAHALARAILEGPDLSGRRIIEIGAGLGLSGLAAAMRGAHVVSTDIRPEAVRLVAENAARNGLTVDARVVDFFAPPADLGLYDGVLAADVIYNDGMLAGVMRFMRAHLAPGGLGCLTGPVPHHAGGRAGRGAYQRPRGRGAAAGLTRSAGADVRAPAADHRL